MELPLGNFFEVTIDSQRLSAWMEDLNRQVRVQADRMDELARQLGGLSGNLGAKMKRNEEAMEEQLERMRRGSQEESNYLRLFLKDADKKTTDKIAEFENSLIMLNNRITVTRDALQDDLALRLSFLEKKMANPPHDHQAEEKAKKDLEAVLETVRTLQRKLDQRMLVLEEARAKGEQDVAEIRRIQSSKNITTRAPSLARSRKRLKSHRNATLYENQKDIDQIVNKISQLENRLQQERDQKLLSNNRIVKISENITSVARLSPEDASPPTSDLAATVSAKLARIEEVVLGRVADCERTIARLANRSEITEEQVGIVVRKFEKERSRVSQVMAGFKKLQERKVDDRAIEQLRTALKKLGKEVEEGLEGKASRETVQREKKIVFERVQTLADVVGEKADKGEVKRGFTFLEEKIKEMIIVLAEEKSCNKDSALKKGAFKCLSCDKDLEATPSEPILPPRLARDSTTSSGRCSTTQIRKRIRLVNNSLNEES